MANISAIKLPNNTTYNIKDNVSGYTTSENITQEEYDALTPAQKSDDIIYFIYDGTPTPGPTPVSNLQNLVDGSATASVRGIGTTAESGSYTIGEYAFAEGDLTKASGDASHAEGGGTIASSYYSHAEGMETIASGPSSHAEGNLTEASGDYSHAEGHSTEAAGDYSHAEGRSTAVNGECSHAEGYGTQVSGDYSHAEGVGSVASGDYSHAEGYNTTASGNYSHAQNKWTVATDANQTVIGKYNKATVSGSGSTQDPYVYTDVGDYAFIIGNGSANTTAARSNALTVDWSGNTSQQGHATTKDMTSSEVTSFVNSLDLTGSKAADYVVEQGTSGIWTYRKWQSGIAECWGNYTSSIAVTIASTEYGGYRSDIVSIPAFPFTFAAVPTLTASIGSGSSGCWVNNIIPSVSGGSFYLSCGGSNAATNRTISLHAIGRWK